MSLVDAFLLFCDPWKTNGTGIVTRVCHPSRHKSHMPSRTSTSYIDIPMVHTRDRQLVAEVVRRWLDSQEVLGSNPVAFHSLVWLPKPCWWDLVKVKTAVQMLVALVWYIPHSWFERSIDGASWDIFPSPFSNFANVSSLRPAEVSSTACLQWIVPIAGEKPPLCDGGGLSVQTVTDGQ